MKKLSVMLLLVSFFGMIMTEELIISNVDRQVLLNGAYPAEQTLITFKSKANINIFKYVLPIAMD